MHSIWPAIFTVFFTLCSCSAVIAETWPSIKPPPEAHVSWVADNLDQNGVPMQIRTFSSLKNVEELLNFYRGNWTKNGKRNYVENKLGSASIIGTQEGNYYLTVQLQPSPTGSQGFLTVSKLPESIRKNSFTVDTQFPRLGGSDVVSDTVSRDQGKLAKTLILKNQQSLQINLFFYKNNMANFGWHLVENKINQKNKNKDQSLYFERGKEVCSVVITREKNFTYIVINVITTIL